MPTGKRKTKSEQKGNDLTKQIRRAIKGLSYTSETDAPIKLFAGSAADAVTQENLLGQIGKADNTLVETRNFDDFFSQLTTVQDWFGDEEKAAVAKFAALRDLLKNNLKDLNVFKIGSVELDVYAVGLDANGNLTGIKTKTVET
ncbi:MAG: nuclease A inhibitor family protein [Pyrinomonadaceae bacterium]